MALERVTRRTFIGWWMASILTSLTVAGIAPILVFLWPAPPKGQKKGPLTIALDTPLNQINDGQAVKFNAPTSPNSAFIMADGGGDNAPGDLALVLDDEACKGKVARRVVASPVGHDERRVGAGRGVELDRLAVVDLVQRRVEGDRQGSLLLALGRRRPEKDEDRRDARDRQRGQDTGHPPTDESPPRDSL